MEIGRRRATAARSRNRRRADSPPRHWRRRRGNVWPARSPESGVKKRAWPASRMVPPSDAERSASKLACDMAPLVTAASRPCTVTGRSITSSPKVKSTMMSCAAPVEFGSRHVEETVGSRASGEHVGSPAALKQVRAMAAGEQSLSAPPSSMKCAPVSADPSKKDDGRRRAPSGDGERLPGADHPIGHRKIVI